MSILRDVVRAPVLWVCLALVCLAAGPSSFAESPLTGLGAMTVTPAEPKVNLADSVYYLRDETAALGIEDVARSEWAAKFAPNSGLSVNLGFSETPVWLRFTLRNGTPQPGHWVIEIRNPRMAFAELYAPTEGKGYVVRRAGTDFSFYMRDIPNPNPSFPVVVAPNTTSTYYLRVCLSGSMRFRLTLWQAAAFEEHFENWTLATNAFLGVLLTMAVYNILIFVGIRERSYLYYSLLILIFLIHQMAFNGTATKYLWPDWPWWSGHSITVLGAAALAVSMLFARAFLHASVYAPLCSKITVALVLANVVLLVLGLFDNPVKYAIGHALAIVSPVVILTMSIQCIRQGYRPARLFFVAWSIVIVGTGVLGLMGPGILPSTIITENVLSVGFVSAVMIFSLALTNRVKVHEEETRRLLEENVNARTADLRQAMAEMKTLGGLLPICAHCKKIRDDQGYWESVETYLKQHTDADFSHGLCPDCFRELYPEYADKFDERHPTAESPTS